MRSSVQPILVKLALLAAVTLPAAGCTTTHDKILSLAEEETLQQAPADDATPLDGLIAAYANAYDVPESLVHRVVKRESTYNPKARNGGHYGLMQIKPATARTMGYRGSASGLYDAETNLKYGVKYLRGAWMLADGSEDRAVRLYSSGYYYVAKKRGMLVETGLRPE